MLQTTSGIASNLLIYLGFLSTFGQLLRPDANLSLAIYLLVAVQSRLPHMLVPLVALILISVLADTTWLILFGPFAHLFGFLNDLSFGPRCNVEPHTALLPMGRLAYVAVGMALKLALIVPQHRLLRACRTLGNVSDFGEETSSMVDGALGRRTGQSVEVTSTPTTARSSLEFGAKPFEQWPDDRRDCVARLARLIGGVGMALFVASFWSCLCRPDAGAMLGLLVLTALNESLLYFSRVAAGATVLTLSIDWLWLRFQAIPGQDASSLLRNISSFEGLLALLSGRPLQLQLAVVSTLVTIPLKVLLVMLLLHLLCLPHVAEQQKFRFDVILEGMGRASPVLAAAVPENIAAHEARAAGRRVAHIMEGQLIEAKRVVTLCFVGLLLATAVGSMGRLVSGMSSMEPFVLTMLAAYGCLRHSKMCKSQPERCRALVEKTAAILVPTAAALALRFVLSEQLHTPWEHVGILDRIAVVSMAASLLLHLLLVGSLLRLRWFLSSLHRSTNTTDDVAHVSLATRLRKLSLAGVGVSCALSVGHTDTDSAIFMLALFAVSAGDEARLRCLYVCSAWPLIRVQIFHRLQHAVYCQLVCWRHAFLKWAPPERTVFVRRNCASFRASSLMRSDEMAG
mmetsp:Transcript_68624/g.205624  ORF Transcript_68624/g.205624 Transcript_68624/m.205624 type:complete len:626 (+) Transcript_68624:858-2735(+)